MEDTTLDCFKSVVGVGVALLSSRPEVSQSKAALAGSVVVIEVVVVVVVVVDLGLVGLMLGAGVVDAVLSSELVELLVEVSQSRAAWIALGDLVDELTLVVVNDGEVVDDVLVFDGF